MPDVTPSATRRKRGFEAAAKLVAADLRGPFEKRGFAEARLLTHWEEIVGEEIAQIAMPVKISHGRGMGGTLVLLTTGANAPVLDMQKARICDRVNACYGYRAVSRVQITQTAPTGFAEGRVAFGAAPAKPAPEPDPDALNTARKAMSNVENPELKQALERLARNVLSKRKS